MKKLIAMLLVAAFVCVSTIGCGGDTKPAGGGAGSTGGAPKTDKK